MTQRRELESRLGLYDELTGILGAMRSFALTELRRVSRRETAQQHTLTALGDTFAAMAPALPVEEPPAADVWLLLGTVRGFCASFNEDILRLWREQGNDAAATIVVGERLQVMMPAAAAAMVPVPGAGGAVDAAPAIDRVLAALTSCGEGQGLVACVRDEHGARLERLLPLQDKHGDSDKLPMTYEAPAHVAQGVARHFLYHRLLSLLLRSLRVENHMRLIQMETALQHIERTTAALQRRRNQLRQGEIVEEIELVLGNRKDLSR